MLDTSVHNLLMEVNAAEQLRGPMIERAQEVTASMLGGDNDTGRTRGTPSPDNYIFEFMALMLGRLVADNPAAACTCPFSQFSYIADAIQESVDKWIKSIDHVGTEFKEQILNVVTDQLILWGATLVTYEEDMGAAPTNMGTRPMRPVSTHIPYWRYFVDPRSAPGIPPRFKGHKWIKDKDDLLNDPHYDHVMVEKMVQDAGAGIGGDAGQMDDADNNSPPRHEVTGYEIWVPDADTSDVTEPSMIGKVRGKIYTIATMEMATGKPANGKKKVEAYLREPVAFYGPAWGPYVEWGTFPVPGSPFTLSALQASKEQGDEVNAQQCAIVKSGLQRKTIILTNSVNNEVKNVVKRSQDGHVYGVKGYQAGMFDQVSIGGPSKEMIDYAGIASERRDRVLGMSEAMRGEPQGGNTATADNISAQANNVRIEMMVGFVKDAVAQTIRTVAWYMFNSEFFVQQLSEEYAKKYGLKEPVYMGGDHKTTAKLRFEDLALDIQPYSMERVDPVLMQGRVQQVSQLIFSTLPMRAQTPWFNWKLWDDQIARAHNFRWVDDLVDEDKLAQWSQMQSQANAEQAKPPTINYKDAPYDIRAQIEAKQGLQPSQLYGQVPVFDPNQPFQSGNPATVTSLARHMMGAMGNNPTEPTRPARRVA